MSRLSKQFETLVSTLKKYELYQPNDDVDEELTGLRNVINEVEKRMLCAQKTSDDIYNTISEYTKNVDKGEEFKMPVAHHDVIHTGCIDINIALDLDDDQPITQNWYSLFEVEAFKITSDIHNSVSGKVFDVLQINLNHLGQRIGELNIIDPTDSTKNLWVNLDLEGICLNGEQVKIEKQLVKKKEIEIILIGKLSEIGMDTPSNFDDILEFVFEDVCSAADPIEWNDCDVIIALRHWIERE